MHQHARQNARQTQTSGTESVMGGANSSTAGRLTESILSLE